MLTTFPGTPLKFMNLHWKGSAFFILMWLYSSKPRPVGAVSAMFLIGYGVFRSFAEFFREPEEGIMGMMTLGISMGQWLSLPMVIAGILMLSWVYRKRPPPFQGQVHRAEPGRPAASVKSPALKKRNRK